MFLSKLLEFITTKEIINSENINLIEFSGISYNSKTTNKGDLFVCLVGEHSDGHDYALQAIEKGASALIVERKLDITDIPLLIVKDTQYELSQIANSYYDFPSKKMRLVGVTGTNGKTTVTHLIQNIFEASQNKCGLIGTLGYRLSSSDEYLCAKHTTPQSPEFQQTLKTMLDKNINNVVTEVSSHALEQYRVGGSEFDGAIFTNLTQDHLDYHITMDNYLNAKAKLFESQTIGEKSNKYAVINIDDKYGHKFLKRIPEGVRVLTYGINNKADIIAKNIEFTGHGSKFECITPLGTKIVNLQMTGLFSIYNALAALGAGIGENIDLNTCIQALESTKSVAGRFEVVTRKPLIIVDYAHTPDGLLNVLNTAKNIVPENGELICVFGCGGDRDSTKRPQMGKIAEDLADKIVITSDNPRSEDPQQILTDILTGIKSLNTSKVMVEADRKQAIELAVKISKENDIILIAGKGHEDYQILKDKTIHFDDREEAKIAFEKIKEKS